MAEVRYNGKGPAERIADRLRNSGVGRGTTPDVTVQKGNSPGRTFTNVHHSAGHHGTDPNPGMTQGRDILRDYGKESK